ncbi:MAG: hypothetical protein IPL35_00005 [Sphingobacteriales bacterium]|nr:hypothetical protein [Sphingobacteriales bacterium]
MPVCEPDYTNHNSLPTIIWSRLSLPPQYESGACVFNFKTNNEPQENDYSLKTTVER